MTDTQITNHKRIAKNTIYLYLRMLITMAIGLYTSRVILNILGVEDYGIYNIVGGVIAMFSLISGSLSGSISRFITYELGKNDIDKLNKIFSTSISIQLILALIIFIIAELIGLWFINHELHIASNRINAAHWVFHCSIASFCIGLIMTPYNATIIAHEKMNVYAYMSIIDTLLKLLIVYALFICPFDKLKTYAVLGVVTSIITGVIYYWYCNRNFLECRYKFILNKCLFKDMFGFAGWNFIGTSAGILRTQGNNILLNIFSGSTIVNAATGITNTIIGVISGFVNGFMTAFEPQITKCYAAQEYTQLVKLLYYGSKFSAYLLLLFAIPIFINTNEILLLWLGVVPEYTVIFTRLVLIYMITETISRPLIIAKNATGKIRNYQIIVGGILLLTLPLSYLFLKIGASFEFVYIANIITSVLAFGARMYMLNGDLPQWSSFDFTIKVYCRVIIVAITASIPPIICYIFIENSNLRFIVSTIISILFTCGAVYSIGCNNYERKFLKERINQVKIRLNIL